MPIKMQREREGQGWSKQRLSYEARVAPQIIGQIELGQRKPCAAELSRIVEALGYTGASGDLLKEVDDADN